MLVIRHQQCNMQSNGRMIQRQSRNAPIVCITFTSEKTQKRKDFVN